MHTFSKNDIACELILGDGYATAQRKTTSTHFHAFYEVHYILSGSVNVVLDEKEILLNEGSICLIPPQVIHRIIEKNGSKRVGFRFSYTKRKCDQEEWYFERFANTFGSLNRALFLKETEFFLQCINASRTALAEKAPDYAVNELLFLAIDHLAYCIGGHQKSNLPTINAFSDSLIAEYIEDYINMNYRGFLKIGDLANSLDVSVRQTQRIIKRLFGKSFSELVTIKRLTVAKHILRNTTLSIEEVAQATGFCDKQYLCRKFSANFGISPAKYRLSKQQAGKSIFSPKYKLEKKDQI